MNPSLRLSILTSSIWLLLLPWDCAVYAQSDPHAIWDQLLKVNGEGDFPPQLKVQSLGTKGPAFYSKRTVYLEADLPAVLDSAFGDQAESALSYVLAHELAHHNCDHICSHFVRRGMKGTETSQLMRDADQQRADSRKHESEADLLAGLYGHIAGFRPLDVADSTLQFLYDRYHLPDSIPGYPSLEERQTIADNARTQLDQVALAYDMAWITCALGMYGASAFLTESILIETKYNAPEIYELLALAKFLEAVEFLSEDYPKLAMWGWPIALSHETNAKSTKRGASNEKWDIIKDFLADAEKWARKGVELHSPGTQDEGLLKSIQFLIAWAQAPDSFLKHASKQKATDDISSNHRALAMWLANPRKNQKKALQVLTNNQHPTSQLNSTLIRGDFQGDTTVGYAECDKLKTKQQTHLLMMSNIVKEQVLLGKSLMFSQEKIEGGFDIQFGRKILAPRVLMWNEPLDHTFCWGFETNLTTRNEVMTAFSGLPFRQLALQQGSFVSFPTEKLAFQFGPDNTLSSISWKSR